MEEAKIIKVEVNNLMAIRFAEVEFDEDCGLVVLGGRNGSGKSSLLQALQFAFNGKKPVDKDVLRYGADRGYVKVTLGGLEFQIRRSINDKGNETLTVKGGDGKAIKAPQTVLNELMGAVGIDPSVIWNMNNVEISKTLRDAMGLDFGDIDEAEKEAFDERSGVNRLLKETATLLGSSSVFDGVPEEKLSVADLLREYKDAEAKNKERADVAKDTHYNTTRCVEIEREIETLKIRIEALTEEHADRLKHNVKLQRVLDETEDIDLGAIQTRMGEVEATNEKIEANKTAAVYREKLDGYKADERRLTAKIEQFRQDRSDRIAAAEFPLEGVEFDHDGTMLLDGKPWRARSDGERLLDAFEISAALSPGLKAVVMRQGSMFDDEAKQIVAKIAKERGYLVLMEVVGDSGEVSIHMDDGQVEDRR